MMEVGYWIDGLDQIDEGVRPGSNLARQFIGERPRVDPVRGRCSNGGGSGLMTRHHAARQRLVARRLRCSIYYEVSSYNFRTTWGTCFTDLGQRRQATPSG
jgi:hypothetical protein